MVKGSKLEEIKVLKGCSRCGVEMALLVLDRIPKPALKCIACYVRDNPDMEGKLQTWLDNHKAFSLRGGVNPALKS